MFRYLALLAAAMLVIGCEADNQEDTADTDEPDETETLAIIGEYTDEFGGDHVITADTWTDAYSGVYTITSFDNAEGVIIAQNGADNAFDPNLWSQFNWFDDGTSLYYCQIAYNAADQAAAAAQPKANSTGVATDGCNGFSWTNLTP